MTPREGSEDSLAAAPTTRAQCSGSEGQRMREVM